MRKLVKFLGIVINKRLITKEEIRMEIFLSKDQVVRLLEGYYQQKEGIPFTVRFEVSESRDTWEDYESEVQREGTMSFLGEEVPFKQRISEEEIKEAFQDMVSSSDYQLETLNYQISWPEKSDDPGNVYPGFEGINLFVKTKEKQKVKGGN